MKRIILTALTVAIATSSFVTSSQAEVRIKHNRSQIVDLTSSQGSSSAPNNTFCGNADSFTIYEEDAQGNPIKGTVSHHCTD
jgi:hypothetical protein